ncbi:nucleotide exchange factor GrpE [Chromatiales bacterium (ex Bugula neritina AB1)]|nr:nucleotide exchange factor GrpE [Chromatiales bacterium (ex Bugula neritina AB1)]
MDAPPISSSTENIAKQAAHAQPQFGLSDMVDAFTAMRHEWRTQSKEGRQHAESLNSSIECLSRIESTIDQKLSHATDDGNLKRLISAVIDLDIGLQRAVRAASESAAEQATRTEQQTQLLISVRKNYEQSGVISRWLSRKFYQSVIEAIDLAPKPSSDATIEGFNLLLARLHRKMAEQKFTRRETVGQPFDAETMKAISAITTEQFPEGHVAEEITPAYFYQSQLVRFAEVRVARSAEQSGNSQQLVRE